MKYWARTENIFSGKKFRHFPPKVASSHATIDMIFANYTS